jgi:hypothetical protein
VLRRRSQQLTSAGDDQRRDQQSARFLLLGERCQRTGVGADHGGPEGVELLDECRQRIEH